VSQMYKILSQVSRVLARAFAKEYIELNRGDVGGGLWGLNVLGAIGVRGDAECLLCWRRVVDDGLRVF